MTTVAFSNDDMTVNMCMCRYMDFAVLLSVRLSG